MNRLAICYMVSKIRASADLKRAVDALKENVEVEDIRPFVKEYHRAYRAAKSYNLAWARHLPESLHNDFDFDLLHPDERRKILKKMVVGM